MAILAIDYGAKKIGLARSDHERRMALPLGVLINKNQKEILDHIKLICQRDEIEKIIVGVPLSLKTTNKELILREQDLQNKQMQEVLAFIDWLKENIKISIEMEDERLSTKLANGLRRDLIKGGPDDAVAAMLILQTYLDKNQKS